MRKYKNLGHVDRPNCFYTSSSSLSSLLSYFHLNLTLILIFSLSRLWYHRQAGWGITAPGKGFSGKNDVNISNSDDTNKGKQIVATKNNHFQPQICYLQPNVFLVIFASFMHAHGWPLDSALAFLGKNVISGSCCNNIPEIRATYCPLWANISCHQKP